MSLRGDSGRRSEGDARRPHRDVSKEQAGSGINTPGKVFEPAEAVRPLVCGRNFVDRLGARAGPGWEEEHLFRITVDESRILHVNDGDGVKEIRKYLVEDDWGFGRGLFDWSKVAKDFAGVEVRPGVWRTAFSGWDVPSGCVWDASAVLSVERLS